MKKAITYLLIVFMMLGYSSVLFADDLSADVDTRIDINPNVIIDAVNELYGDRGIKISSEDLDYSGAYKVYVDNNIFELSTNDANEIVKTLEDGNFIYLLPIITEKGTVVVNIQRGLPLSDNAKAVLSSEEQQEVLDNVGKWIVSSLSFYEKGNLNYDYETTLSNIIGEIPEDTVLVGSLPIFQDVVAVIPNEKGIMEKIVPLTNKVSEKTLSAYSKNNIETFDYQQIKSTVLDLLKNDPNMAGTVGNDVSQNNYQIALVAGILIFIALVVAITLYFKMKKRVQ